MPEAYVWGLQCSTVSNRGSLLGLSRACGGWGFRVSQLTEEPVRQPREMQKTTFRWPNSWQVHGERPHRCLWVELAPVPSWLGLRLCFQFPGDNQWAEQSRHTAVFRLHLPLATELCCPGGRLLPDVPPAFQVLPNHLHGDALLEANLVLALASVGLHGDILLFCEWVGEQESTVI